MMKTTDVYKRQDYDCLCDQHTGVRTDWSKMGEQRKRKNAEPRNRNPAVRAGTVDAVLLKKILSGTKPDRIFLLYPLPARRLRPLRDATEKLFLHTDVLKSIQQVYTRWV